MEDDARIKLPELVNPFKMAFEAGRNLRATLANNLEQITGAASPVRYGDGEHKISRVTANNNPPHTHTHLKTTEDGPDETGLPSVTVNDTPSLLLGVTVNI